jgi:hypothetical protein
MATSGSVILATVQPRHRLRLVPLI